MLVYGVQNVPNSITPCIQLVDLSELVRYLFRTDILLPIRLCFPFIHLSCTLSIFIRRHLLLLRLITSSVLRLLGLCSFVRSLRLEICLHGDPRLYLISWRRCLPLHRLIPPDQHARA